mmetsp:Transcript_8603/g.17318  ORF Transcript_8603/g.17318 Transcript_8603/m.17318 type:complete len:258 (-) Transcript_8603:105-878(-)
MASLFTSCVPAQVRIDKRTDAPVEDILHVRRLVLRAQVLDHLVRCHHVAAYLLSPLGHHLLASDLAELLDLLLALHDHQLGLEQLERTLLVAQLAALLLAAHDQPRGQVLDPYRRLDLVHVLPSGAAGASGADLQLVLRDLERAQHLLGQQRHHLHSRKARLPLVGRVERREAHQPVRPVFGAQRAVGELTLDDDSRALDACLVARCLLGHPHTVPCRLSPPPVHAQQHGRPVLCVDATRARDNAKRGSATIVLAAH